MIVTAILAVQLTVHDIIAVHPVTGNPPSAFTWSPDGTRYVYSVDGAREKDPPILRIHDVRTGSDRVLLAARSQERGSRSRAIEQIVWSHDGRHIAFLGAGALHVAAADGSQDTALAEDADDPQWSPDDTRVAYVHDNDLYVVSLATHARRRLTFDGSPTRINGDPDWLYSEELDVDHAYRWSPSSDEIAYLSFDESPIVPFPIENFLPTINTVEEQRYPLAGGANPRVSLHVVDLHGGATRTLYDGGPRDEYVLSFTWTPDGESVVDEIIDRAQKHLRLVAFAANGSQQRTILRESDSKFIDDQPVPMWLEHGQRFLWISQRDGVQALYRVDTRTGAYTRLTGNYPVASIERVDEPAGAVYVDAFYPTRRDRALLRVSLHGGAATDLTPGFGSHEVVMPERGNSYIETDSSFNSPPVISLRALNSRRDAILFSTPDLSRFELGTVRRLEIPSQWGPLDAFLVVPRDFDPSKRYPVVVTAYGGPLPVSWGVPSNDRWQGLFPFLLAQHGFLSFTIDGPASNADRSANERLFYLEMGRIAMAGQLAGVKWLTSQPFVDPKRLGLTGWSYGGYLTAFTLTHSPDTFASGISGAPPADWHYYDTAYTERYMGMPHEQRAAYRRTSVLPAAPHLRAKLLILQGSSDDNVHLMNSIALLRAFMNAGKQVQYFVYPGARHGPTGIAANRDRLTRMLDWWEQTL